VIYAQEVPSDTVEIIVGGERYESILAYQREQIKNILLNALAAYDLQMFTEEELCGVIRKVRNQKIADTSSIEPNELRHSQSDTQKQDQRNSEKDTLDPGLSQMKEMLKDYLREHGDTDPVLLDPDKVKNVIIEPKAESGTSLSD